MTIKNEKDLDLDFIKVIKQIEKNGIQVNRKNIKRDMCTQFADPDEWIREYVVNSYDAGATDVFISGTEDENTITIHVKDNGHGMDKQGIIDFNTVYRSVKRKGIAKTVGQHGVGKLSSAAIPGQCGFEVKTSTGEECWHYETGCLLDNEPLDFNRVEPVPPQGTQFSITFKKRFSLNKTLLNLKNILQKYVKYLPVEITIFGHGKVDEQKDIVPIHIGEVWADPDNYLVKTYNVNLNGHDFEIVLELGKAVHELYQNRVLISTKYNLFSYGLRHYDKISCLKIQVDSPDFELPFGRHCLINEEILSILSAHLRKTVVPDYFTYLMDLFETEVLILHENHLEEFEELAVSLMTYDSNTYTPWSQLPIFYTNNFELRLSMARLTSEVSKFDLVFLENEKSTGTDYSIFNAPVLSIHQPVGGLDLLKEKFSNQLRDMNTNNFVMEAPEGQGKPLREKELNFQAALGLHPEAIRHVKNSRNKRPGRKPEKSIESIDISTVCQESKLAKNDMEKIEWRVNYLVQHDGITPSLTHKYMFDRNRVTLNLYHNEISRFLDLSETSPDIAGHFAVAMCLTDNNVILPHLTPEAREDLIQVDAITRFSKSTIEDDDDFKLKLDFEDEPYSQKYKDFKRRLISLRRKQN